jgi:hypothetical protein
MKLKFKEKKAVIRKENTASHYQTKITVLFAFLVVLLLFTPVLSSSTVVKAESTNLAPIPDGWSTANTTNENGIGGTPYIVYPVSWQGKTAVRLDPDPDYIAIGWPCTNEINSAWFPIKPGDHIIYKMWLWVESSTVGDDGNAYAGAMMGIDVYGNGRICGLTTPDGKCAWPNYGPEYTQNIVPFGTMTWIQKTMDFIVQDTYMADPYGGHTAYEVVVPNGCIPTLNIYTHHPTTEKASIYFAGAELYISESEGDELTLSLSPQYVARGEQLTISGQLTPGQATTISLYYRFPHQWGAWSLAGTLNTNAAGAYYAVTTVPYSLSFGTHDLVAVWVPEGTGTYTASPVRSFTVT